MSEERPKAIVTSLDLLKLRNSRITHDAGEEGIFIPFRPNGVFKYRSKANKISAFLKVFHFPRKDNYGNDFMVSRQRTSAEIENNLDVEILGNSAHLEKGKKLPGTPSPQKEQPQPERRRDYEEEPPF